MTRHRFRLLLDLVAPDGTDRARARWRLADALAAPAATGPLCERIAAGGIGGPSWGSPTVTRFRIDDDEPAPSAVLLLMAKAARAALDQPAVLNLIARAKAGAIQPCAQDIEQARRWLAEGIAAAERADAPPVLWARISGDDGRAQAMPVSVRVEGDALVIRDDGGGRLFGVGLVDDTPCAFTWRDGCDDAAEIVATLPLHGPDVEPTTPDVVHAAPDASALHALDVIADALDAREWTADVMAYVAAVVRETGRRVRDVGPEFPDDPNHDDEREASAADAFNGADPDEACDACRDADGGPIALRWTYVCPACDVSHHGAPCRECGRRGYHTLACPSLRGCVADCERGTRS